jgi:hypothetical protein
MGGGCTLLLFQDKTFKAWKNPSKRQEAIDNGWDQFDDPANKKYKIAFLMLISNKGKELETVRLDTIFGDEAIWIMLGKDDLYGSGRKSFFVEKDNEVGMGTGQGDETCYFDVIKDHIVWLTSTDDAGGKELITLYSNMEVTWKAFPNPHGNGKVLCERFAHPYENTTDYVRYEFNNNNWVRYKRVEKGAQDFETPFPSIKKFY